MSPARPRWDLAVDEQAERDLVSAEMVTLPITPLVLLLVFGSAIAAGLPLLVSAVAVVDTLAVLGLIAEATTTPRQRAEAAICAAAAGAGRPWRTRPPPQFHGRFSQRLTRWPLNVRDRHEPRSRSGARVTPPQGTRPWAS